MKKKWIYGLLILAMILPACKKFLDIDRSTDTNPTPVTVNDYEQILNSTGICEVPLYTLSYLTDDCRLTVKKDLPITGAMGFYLWQADPWLGTVDATYNGAYKWIAQMNLVIANMPTALPAGENGRRALAIAQAKINRAYFYLLLANIYGEHYEPNTASSNLAVPLVLQANNRTSLPRASVAQVYQQVLKDLQEALATPELPNVGSDIIHPGRAGALALLARTYLYMGRYPEANDAATAALVINDKLFDYRNLLAAGTYGGDGRLLTLLEYRNHPEVLLARVAKVAGIGERVKPDEEMAGSEELIALFDRQNDKRFTASFGKYKSIGELIMYRFGQITGFGSVNYVDNGLGVPEMMLTKAECLARANDPAGAINLLNRLRTYRIVNHQALSTNVTADVALRLVLDERRRELMFKGGIRLFDLKRLNLDPRFRKDIIRRDYPARQYMLTLPAGSPNYVVPFTPSTMVSNPLLVQNPNVALQ